MIVANGSQSYSDSYGNTRVNTDAGFTRIHTRIKLAPNDRIAVKKVANYEGYSNVSVTIQTEYLEYYDALTISEFSGYKIR